MVTDETVVFQCPECGAELEECLGRGYDERSQAIVFDGVKCPNLCNLYQYQT